MISTSKSIVDQRVRRAVVRMVLGLGMALSSVMTHAASRTCTREQAKKAETEASSLETWRAIFISYKRYSHCDDGAIAEGYSHSVATLLDRHWDQFEQLAALVSQHPKFEGFVIRHIDETMTSDQSKAIEENVRSRCPKNGNRLCGLIKKRFTVLSSGQK